MASKAASAAACPPPPAAKGAARAAAAARRAVALRARHAHALRPAPGWPDTQAWRIVLERAQHTRTARLGHTPRTARAARRPTPGTGQGRGTRPGHPGSTNRTP
eukprot:scaffold94584_cov57-Phaeocystis_antarctica.AAC.4